MDLDIVGVLLNEKMYETLALAVEVAPSARVYPAL